MTRQMGKRIISLLCVWIALSILGAMCPLSVLAEDNQATGIDFQIKASLEPYALDQSPDRFLKGLKKALDSLDLTGHAVLQNGQVDITGNLNLNGLPAIDFHLVGWEKRLSLLTNLFGDKPVVITPPNYIPFLMKMYYYFDIPVQYIGVFTDPYSYMHGIEPVLDKWTELLGGTGSRTYSPEESIGKAAQLSDAISGNAAFQNWLKGLLQYVGLDDLIFEFFLALPEWTANLVGDEGLIVQASSHGEIWTLGGETVYTLRLEGNKSTWKLNLPEWEGYRLSAQCELEEKDGGLQLFMDWKLFEDNELRAYLTAEGQNLPDGKRMQGDGSIRVSFGGDGLGLTRTYMAGLKWDQRQDGGKTILDGQVRLLNPATGRAILTVDGGISWGSTQETFQQIKAKDIEGIDLFCMNDTTIRIFFSNAKWSAIRTAIPFLVEMPTGFLSGLVDWMEERGILLTLMDGLKN